MHHLAIKVAKIGIAQSLSISLSPFYLSSIYGTKALLLSVQVVCTASIQTGDHPSPLIKNLKLTNEKLKNKKMGISFLTFFMTSNEAGILPAFQHIHMNHIHISRHF